MATATTGTLTQKMARQPKPSTRAPPRTGPSASDRPDTEPNTPIALARSAGSGNVLAVMAMATGLSMVPPAACTARAAISQPMPGARLHSSEPSPKAARPTWKTRRRPTRSAVAPASTRKLASTRVYASTVHCRPDSVACRSRPMAGSATFTMEMSITTTKMLVQQMARTSHRRRRGRAGELMATTLGFRACSKST